MKRKKLLIFSFLPYTGNSIKAVYRQTLELFGPLKEQEGNIPSIEKNLRAC